MPDRQNCKTDCTAHMHWLFCIDRLTNGLAWALGPQMPRGQAQGEGRQLRVDKTGGRARLGLACRMQHAVATGYQAGYGMQGTTPQELWEHPEPMAAGSRVGWPQHRQVLTWPSRDPAHLLGAAAAKLSFSGVRDHPQSSVHTACTQRTVVLHAWCCPATG